jgi:uncharacterized protein (DUF433 family)
VLQSILIARATKKRISLVLPHITRLAKGLTSTDNWAQPHESEGKCRTPPDRTRTAHRFRFKICGGQPTFKGTRIMVWIVLEQLDRGLTWDEIVSEWSGKVSKTAIFEAIAIADLVVKHEPFKGFHVGARRKSARIPTSKAA